jgi:hypothetical protein
LGAAKTKEKHLESKELFVITNKINDATDIVKLNKQKVELLRQKIKLKKKEKILKSKQKYAFLAKKI